MDEDERSALRDRKGVTPLSQRVAERDPGGRDRVEGLTRDVRARPRHPHDEGVERLVQTDPAELDRPDESLDVRRRRPAGERGRGGERPALVTQDPAPYGAR